MRSADSLPLYSHTLLDASSNISSRGAIQFPVKEYDKALETYQEGLKHDPNS